MEATSVLTSSHQRRSSPAAAANGGGKKQPKQRSKKTKPIKVRYISNPMKVETCASKFRELVQELTGQDAADLPPEPATLSPAAAPPLVPSTCCAAENPFADGGDDHREQFDWGVDPVPDYFESLDGDVLANQMAENFPECFANRVYYATNALGSIGSEI